MHAFVAKLGALAFAPFMFFGAHAAVTAHHATTAKPEPTHVSRPASQSALKITSIDGPASLAVGSQGSWTVNAKSSGDDTLRYSVVWGDEGTTTGMRAMTALVASSATLTHTYASAGTYAPTFTVTDDSGRTATKSMTVTVGATAPLHLDSVTPTSGAVGTTATLSGTGFADDDTVTVGGVKAKDVTYNSDGTITFAIPSLATGEYYVRVHDASGRSNPVSFTVTAQVPSISISGVDAPVRLDVGASGTWTVHAVTTDSSLRYSVVWGDEGTGMMRAMTAAETTQASSTFTHAYSAAGTYSPTFTITDDSGHSESVSASVVVTDNT